MPFKIAFIIDPIVSINTKKDSTVAMIEEAQLRGYEISVLEQNDLFILNGVAYADTQTITIDLEKSPWFSVLEKQTVPLSNFNFIFMRKDPPFDMQYIYTTQILELAENAGCRVINKPQSLRDANEKIAATWFPEFGPPTLVARDIEKFKAFTAKHKEVILKPLDGMGGRSIYLVKDNDPNLTVILESLTQYNSEFIMAQKYIPEIKQGDKRILLINGEPIPYGLARIPQGKDIRGNLAAGAIGQGFELSKQDLEICKAIGPTLKEKGLIFVGIDVIGDYLTEINVTSPTCIREIDALFDINISAQLLDCVERL